MFEYSKDFLSSCEYSQEEYVPTATVQQKVQVWEKVRGNYTTKNINPSLRNIQREAVLKGTLRERIQVP